MDYDDLDVEVDEIEVEVEVDEVFLAQMYIQIV